MMNRLYAVYTFAIIASLTATLYSLFVPGITKPEISSTKMKESLNLLPSRNLISITESSLDKDTSDRKSSKLIKFTFDDGSKVLAKVVRVRKRDDFKIETYGMLTKGFSEIYIQNPRSTNSVPFSIYGVINKRSSLQTCIVPGTTRQEQVDIRLSALTNAVERLDTTKKSFLSKLLGSEKIHDYSCLVLTYQPSSAQTQSDQTKTWLPIIGLVQSALVK